jgi:hypothetical protein
MVNDVDSLHRSSGEIVKLGAAGCREFRKSFTRFSSRLAKIKFSALSTYTGPNLDRSLEADCQ